LAGIFFASGTSGAIQASAVRNQKGQVQAGCGYGIWLENASGVSETIEAANVSVHDFDTVGINAVSPQNPPTLSVNFQNNAVHSTGDTVGIAAEGVIGTVTRNVVTGGSVAIFDFESQPNTPGLNVSGNRVAGSKVGIVLREGSTASNNQISNTQTALSLNAKPVSSSLTITANTIKNAAVAVDYNCVSSVFFASNTINDAAIAYNHPPSALIITAHPLVNPIYNVDAITAGSCP
jgi:hypothetical protein